MEQILATMGTQAIGFILLYWYINITMKNQTENNRINAQVKISEMESHKEDVNKLCEKIDKMIDIIYDLQIKDKEKSIQIQNNINRIEDMYIRIAKKHDDIKEMVKRVDIRTELCPNAKKIEEEKVNELF